MSSDGNEWPELRELPRAFPAPSLTEAMLPETLRPWILDAAERMCVPLEFIAVPALVSLGSVVGRSIAIHPKRFDDWLEVPNFWGAIVGRPGVLKSPAMAEGTFAIARLAERERTAFKSDALDAASRQETIDAEIKIAKREIEAAARKHDDRRLNELQSHYRSLLERQEEAQVHERRFVTQDATVEKLGELLQHNRQGLLLQRDELSGWLQTLEKPGREGDREFFLEAWNGHGHPFTVDRIKRGTLHIESPCLSVLGGIQPSKLRSYVSAIASGGPADDGLFQRFQLVVWPDDLGDWKNIDRPPDAAAREVAFHVYETLAKLSAEHTTRAIPQVLRFDKEAQITFDLWREALELRLRYDPELQRHPSLMAYVGKQRKTVPTLALLFELADSPAAQSVSNRALLQAISWGEFLELHARKVFLTELPGRFAAAESLRARIQSGEIPDGLPVRDLVKRGWSNLSQTDCVLHALRLLEDAGWLRLAIRQTGGRPSTVIRLRPGLPRR